MWNDTFFSKLGFELDHWELRQFLGSIEVFCSFALWTRICGEAALILLGVIIFVIRTNIVREEEYTFPLFIALCCMYVYWTYVDESALNAQAKPTDDENIPPRMQFNEYPPAATTTATSSQSSIPNPPVATN